MQNTYYFLIRFRDTVHEVLKLFPRPKLKNTFYFFQALFLKKVDPAKQIVCTYMQYI